MGVTDNINLENARIFFKNFKGASSKFNREGDRNFSVRIEDPDLAQRLMDDGWNIREYQPDENEDIQYSMRVAVSFRVAPPKIYMVSGGKKTPLDEDDVSILDNADIKSVDLTIRPYNWEIGEKRGVKAYLKTMYVVLEEDEWAAKYAEDEAPVEWN